MMDNETEKPEVSTELGGRVDALVMCELLREMRTYFSKDDGKEAVTIKNMHAKDVIRWMGDVDKLLNT